MLAKDQNFVPVRVTDSEGRTFDAFYYKPQQLIVTSYITRGYAEHIGWKIEEKNTQS